MDEQKQDGHELVAETGVEIDPDSYDGEIGLEGDTSYDVTWEWDEDAGRYVAVRWR